MFTRIKNNRIAWVCCLATTISLVYLTQSVTHSLSAGGFLYLLLLPLAMYCLGDAFLRRLSFSLSHAQQYPCSFLFGAVLYIILLFLLHFFVSGPLWVQSLVLIIASFTAYWLTSRDRSTVPHTMAWQPVAATLLILIAAALWSQESRPGLIPQGQSMLVRPWGDVIVFAELAAELEQTPSMRAMGDPDLAGRHIPLYHYASFVLPASLEAWSPQITAFDSVMAIWSVFGFMLLGFSAFCLASEWAQGTTSYIAGVCAVTALLMFPSPPLYGIPMAWYSFHWLVSVSLGLAYGIAGAATGLLLITRGLRENRNLLLLTGLGLLAATVCLKAHIALVSLPLALLWIVVAKKGWTGRVRLLIGIALAFGSFIVLKGLDHAKIGPNILPTAGRQGLGYFIFLLGEIQPGFWHHLIFHRPIFSHIGKLIAMPTLLLATVLGIWFGVALLIFFVKWRRRTLQSIDLVPVLATLVFLYYSFLPAFNQRGGGGDELWHRPFVWLYFVVVVWSACQLATWLQRRLEDSPNAVPRVIVALAFVLLAVPAVLGKTVQHSMPRLQHGFTDVTIETGWYRCALYVRDHAAATDIVQNREDNVYPLLPAFAERRAYLGRTVDSWSSIQKGTPAEAFALHRESKLAELRSASTAVSLTALSKETGIRWYIAAPDELLSWPAEFAGHPVFQSDGFRLYDLRGLPSS